MLAGIAARGGKLRFQRNIPTPDGQPAGRPAAGARWRWTGGRVYVAFGGLAGDCGPYRGSVVGRTGLGARRRWCRTGCPRPGRAASGRAGGPVIGPGGTIYVAVGNGAATAPPWDHSDSVTALTPALRLTGIFAPATWPDDNAHDLDLGSTAPGLLSDGQILRSGKRGTGYLLNAGHLRAGFAGGPGSGV